MLYTHASTMNPKHDNLLLDRILSVFYPGKMHTTEKKIIYFTWLLDIRERLLEATTPASGVTLVGASTPGGNRGLPQLSVYRKIYYYYKKEVLHYTTITF